MSDNTTFSVDRVEYAVEAELMTGGQIRALAKVPHNYQLLMEGEGGSPDSIVPHAAQVPVSGRRFYVVPPTTYA